MIKKCRKEALYMDKLKVTVVSEDCAVEHMEGCGRNNDELCGARNCAFNGGAD